jgi:hypothetical protein
MVENLRKNKKMAKETKTEEKLESKCKIYNQHD